MRFLLSIWICKAAIFAGKLMGKKGSSAPGGLALRISPSVLKKLSAQVKHKTIAICGTNGKTTTNNLIYTILRAKGFRVVCNNVGANMLPGVATAYIDACNIFGKLNADYAAIEMDEASAVKIFDHVSPDYMVITNLFRDQLDRYGEIDITADLLKAAIEKAPNVTLILNSDDPLCVAFGKLNRNSVYFGIDSEIKYNYHNYGQEFPRPTPDFCATNVKLTNNLEFSIGNMPISVNYRGFYNIYNILAAFSAVSLIGEKTDNVNEILAAYKPQIGRMEEFSVGGVPVILNLSKNPAGFNQAISTMLADPRKKAVAVIINDRAGDGIDISWLWDVDFERMNGEGFSSFAVSGIRAEDVALRLKYAEISDVVFEKDIKKAIEVLLESQSEVLYVLVNYTPLFETQSILKDFERGGNNAN